MPLSLTAFPIGKDQISSGNPFIVGMTPIGMFTGHWSRRLAMYGWSSDDLVFRKVWVRRIHHSRMS